MLCRCDHDRRRASFESCREESANRHGEVVQIVIDLHGVFGRPSLLDERLPTHRVASSIPERVKP
jgi:hypothetical protein